MPASRNCSATTSSSRSVRLGSASTCRRMCRPTGRCEASGCSRPLQRRMQVLDQIVGMLEAGREANETFADAELGARFRREPLMRCGGGMGDKALGVAEIVRDPRNLQPIEKTERAGLAALRSEERRVGKEGCIAG